MFTGSYNALLVLCSFLVAILASYTALDMAGRISSTSGRVAQWWLTGAAAAMGFGIWSMHFIGMLAFRLPIQIGYDLPTTLLSLCIAIASAALALWLISKPTLPKLHLALGALLLGGGISAMHYTGMAAMQMSSMHYNPMLLVLSIVIAVLASGTALWVAFRMRLNESNVPLYRTGAAIIMGFAICGMHYTGMAAAEFPMGSHSGGAITGFNGGWLALLVITVTLAILGLSLIHI